MKLHFEITTPERTVYKEEIDSLTVMTSSGEITILPNHIPLVSQLVPGELTAKVNGESNHLAVSGGFLEVRSGNQVVILADAAERAEEIDINKAEEARERARKLIGQERQDSEKFVEASAALEKSLIRLRVARRARHRGHHGGSSEGILQDT
jgi:F-type H+-transporting ATPase subunit epsilon